MIALIQNMSTQRSSELRAEGGRRRLLARARRSTGMPVAGEGAGGQPAIRRLDRDGADREALERVAGRDSAVVPDGDLLGAEVDGRLVAALSLSSGRLIADPFVPTASAALLLRHRAARLEGEGERGTRRRVHRLAPRLRRRPGALRP